MTADGPTAKVAALVRPTRSEWPAARRSVAAGVGGQLAGIGLLATSGWLITTASLRPPVLTLMVAIAAVQAFSLSRGLARYAERLAGHDLALRILARVRTWAYDRIQPQIPAGIDDIRGGDLLARFVADVDGIMDIYIRAALPLLTATLSVAVTALVAALLDAAAGLVILGGTVVAIGIGSLVGIAARGSSVVRLPALRGERDATTTEALTGGIELVAFSAQSAVLARIAATDRAVNRLSLRLAYETAAGQAMSVALAGLLPAAAIAVSFPALRAGHLSGPAVAVLAFLALGAADTTAGLPEALTRLRQGLAAGRRIAALGDTSPATSPAAPADPALIRNPPPITFHDVSVCRPGRPQPALSHLNLEIAPGEHLAIIGPSGAGKTTLTHLLLGFLPPTHGIVTLSDRLASEAVAGQIVAWAPQTAHIFAASVADNLRLACPKASDKNLADALRRVGLEPWLHTLPDGLATQLGERATTISGGEAQRLGLARVILADRLVLVLDEPTSHLDETTADLIRNTLRQVARGRTLIWITHDIRETNGFDRVLTLCEGQIVTSATAQAFS